MLHPRSRDRAPSVPTTRPGAFCAVRRRVAPIALPNAVEFVPGQPGRRAASEHEHKHESDHAPMDRLISRTPPDDESDHSIRTALQSFLVMTAVVLLALVPATLLTLLITVLDDLYRRLFG
jgi:hypothetical protein